MNNSKYKNRLINSSSPYLLQHSNNPVDWREWNQETLQYAQNSNKPMLISIGYSACHWCHVMEDESFMDEEIAEFMNANFVCIKVDREERPDIDQIYMNAAQLISGRGGWPLNAFALPDAKPFYAATYFQPQTWLNLLNQIIELYKNDFNKVKLQASNITEGINKNEIKIEKFNSDDIVPENLFHNYSQKLKSYIDYRNGGFGRAPKFPLPTALNVLLHSYILIKDFDLLEASNLSLQQMLKGGIYDQIGGGFARYAVDDHWFVPHFEKMLYDNAQLISIYSDAFKLTSNPDYKIIVEETIAWSIRELKNPDSAFFSSLNADSENEEGKYYVWDFYELYEVLGKDDFDIFVDYYNITKHGNWESSKNIPFLKTDRRKYAESKSISIADWSNKLNAIKQKVLAYRLKRIPPSTDDKILTSWNAMMLKSLLIAYKTFSNKKYLDLATKNANFLIENIISKDYMVYRNYKNNIASTEAFLEDYACLIDAFTEFYQTTFDKKYLEIAENLLIYTIDYFKDKNSAFFFYTSDISEALIARKIEFTDNVIPASNSMLALSAFKLGRILGKQEYVRISKEMLLSIKDSIVDGGPYYANWAVLASFFSNDFFEIVIVGENYLEMSNQIQKHYIPNAIFVAGDNESLKLMKGRLKSNKTLVYVCENNVCNKPVSSFEDVISACKKTLQN